MQNYVSGQGDRESEDARQDEHRIDKTKPGKCEHYEFPQRHETIEIIEKIISLDLLPRKSAYCISTASKYLMRVWNILYRVFARSLRLVFFVMVLLLLLRIESRTESLTLMRCPSPGT